ncbi:MAG TPA: hypothetical protein VGO71_12825 [Baekduia sp.]|nr:hypothetical protein [Baekduia sp.]
MPLGVTGWHSPAQVALLALAGAGVLGGGLAGVTVAGSLYPGATAAPRGAPAIAEERAAPVVRTSLAIGATSSASRWPTPSLSAAGRRAHARPRRPHHVATASQATAPVVAVQAAAPIVHAPAVQAARPASTPASARGGAISAPVTRRPAPVVVRPAPRPAPIRTPAPKPAARAPQPTAAFDDSG